MKSTWRRRLANPQLITLTSVLFLYLPLVASAQHRDKKASPAAAVTALNKKTTKELIFQLQFGSVADAKLEALKVLVERAMGGTDAEVIVDAILPWIRNANANTRKLSDEAVAGLATIGVPALKQTLAEVHDAHNRINPLAIRTVGLMGPAVKEPALQLFLPLREDATLSKEIRIELIKAIVNLGCPIDEALKEDAAMAMRESKIPEERIKMALALYQSKLDKPQSLVSEIDDVLFKCLEKPGKSKKTKDAFDRTTMVSILVALIQIDSPVESGTLRAYMSSVDPYIKGDVYTALGDKKIVTGSSIALLREQLGSKDKKYPLPFATAAHALGQLGAGAKIDRVARDQILAALVNFIARFENDGVPGGAWVKGEAGEAIKKIESYKTQNP